MFVFSQSDVGDRDGLVFSFCKLYCFDSSYLFSASVLSSFALSASHITCGLILWFREEVVSGLFNLCMEAIFCRLNFGVFNRFVQLFFTPSFARGIQDLTGLSALTCAIQFAYKFSVC